MRGPTRQIDPYIPDGPDGSHDPTPDERAKAFTEHVQPKALRFPPYQYRRYPRWEGRGATRRLVHGPGEETPTGRQEPVQHDPVTPPRPALVPDPPAPEIPIATLPPVKKRPPGRPKKVLPMPSEPSEG